MNWEHHDLASGARCGADSEPRLPKPPTEEEEARRMYLESLRGHSEGSSSVEKLPENDLKYDRDAIPLQLLPVIPLMRIAEVFAYGAEKYAANSWRRKDVRAVSWMRTYGSILRHLMKWAAGEEYDKESIERGRPQKHLCMAATQLMILIEHTETESGEDDRHKNVDESSGYMHTFW